MGLCKKQEERVTGGPSAAFGCQRPSIGSQGTVREITQAGQRRKDKSGERRVWGRQGPGHLRVPAWYLRVLTLCLWAGNVRTQSPVSVSQHLTVLSALPEYRSRSTSWRSSGEGLAHQACQSWQPGHPRSLYDSAEMVGDTKRPQRPHWRAHFSTPG